MDPKIELPLELELYNNEWPQQFEKEKKKLNQLHPTYFTRIEHIGATSIPKSSAKPIIDILAIIDGFDEIDNIISILNEKKYVFSNKHRSGKYYYFIKHDNNNIFYSLTVMSSDNPKDINKLLSFKKFLMENPKAASKYQFLKSVLSIEYPDDQNKYANAKDEFVNDISKNFK
ncbi:GrpB family protein [Mycoplasma sp. P36-A1]|uniref:GrpB family protein n=1 Tax=Mycoplasma sp. P36-A1 TaxID=3252900 RepID=UPI003C306E75